MNVLVISPVFPYPARDGLTIPIVNYIKLLKNCGFNIDLAVLSDFDSDNVPEINFDIENIYKLKIRKNKLLSLYKELTMQTIYAASYKVIQNSSFQSMASRRYDFILCSPLSSITAAIFIKRSSKLNANVKIISAISDCYTAELFNSGECKKYLNLNIPNLTRIISRIRAKFVKHIEPALLGNSNTIFVQSENDKNWLKNIGDDLLNNKTIIFTNGVNDLLFDLPLNSKKVATRYGFIADLRSKLYQARLYNLYTQVWCKLNKNGKTLYIYGRGLPKMDPLFKNMLEDESVIFIDDFIEDIRDIYRNLDVTFAPIYKSYGFINKVGEAMASGVAVIGDSTAFNAIEGFQNNIHGIIANSPSEMVLAAEKLASSDNISILDNIKIKARNLSTLHMKWSNKLALIEKSFDYKE